MTGLSGEHSNCSGTRLTGFKLHVSSYEPIEKDTGYEAARVGKLQIHIPIWKTPWKFLDSLTPSTHLKEVPSTLASASSHRPAIEFFVSWHSIASAAINVIRKELNAPEDNFVTTINRQRRLYSTLILKKQICKS